MTVAKIQFHASTFFWLAFVLRSRTHSWARTPRATGRYARRDGAWPRCSHGFGVMARRVIRVAEPGLGIAVTLAVMVLILRGV